MLNEFKRKRILKQIEFHFKTYEISQNELIKHICALFNFPDGRSEIEHKRFIKKITGIQIKHIKRDLNPATTTLTYQEHFLNYVKYSAYYSRIRG